MITQPVLPNNIYQIWDKVSPFIEAAFKAPGADTTVDQAKVFLVKGMWHLAVIVEDNDIIGAIVVEYINRANDRIAFVIAVGGRGVATKSAMDGLKNIVRANGATKIEGAVSESVSRLWKIKFDAKEKYRIVEVSL